MKKNRQLSYTHEGLLSSLDIQGWNLKSFSEEIYENIGQLLSLAKIQIATINPDKKEEAKQITESSEQLLNRIIKDLRNLAKQLSPAEIMEKGFLSSLQYELERLNKLEIGAIHFETTGNSFRLEELKELILFSIIQHYILRALYIENIKQIDVIAGFSKTMIRISINYPVSSELLPLKKIKKGTGVLKRAEHIGAVVSVKRKNNRKEISICIKQ
jgi:signal transduction histidine kinase